MAQNNGAVSRDWTYYYRRLCSGSWACSKQYKAVCAVVRSHPRVLAAPLLVFALLTGVGLWAVYFSAIQESQSLQNEALSLARNAAAQYRTALVAASLPVEALATQIQLQPNYLDVQRVFNAAAPLLGRAVPTRALMRLQLLPAGVLRMVYPPLPPTQGTNGLTTSLGYDIFSAADAEVRDSLRRSLRDPRLSIDGPLPGTEPTPELRVLVVRQAVYVNVTNPQEDFGRPDSPNPACGAPCEFQPATYAPPPAAAGGDSSTAAAALAGGGGGEGGAVVGRLWWGMVVAVIYLDAFTTDASHLDLLAKSNPSAAASAAASTSNSSSITTSTNTSTISSISDSTSGSSGSSLAAAGLAAEVGGAGAALRALSDLGYRYSITNALGGLVAASAQLPSAARGAAVEAAMELPGTQWVLRVSPASADDGNWMPVWTGGVMAAVVVAAAIAAVMLFGLLVSRRRHAMLLEALLPPDMLHGLRSNSAVVAEKMDPSRSPRITESPAELLMDLLAELLAGQAPDLRQVVVLRSLLLRNADWYRPLGMGGQLLRNANLEDDVARALMRQLGTGFPEDDPDRRDQQEEDPQTVMYMEEDLDGMEGLEGLDELSIIFAATGAVGGRDRPSQYQQQHQQPRQQQRRPQQRQQAHALLVAGGGGDGDGDEAAHAAAHASHDDADGDGDGWRGSGWRMQELLLSTQGLERLEREAAAAARCRTLRGALSLILDDSEEGEEEKDARAAAAAVNMMITSGGGGGGVGGGVGDTAHAAAAVRSPSCRRRSVGRRSASSVRSMTAGSASAAAAAATGPNAAAAAAAGSAGGSGRGLISALMAATAAATAASSPRAAGSVGRRPSAATSAAPSPRPMSPRNPMSATARLLLSQAGADASSHEPPMGSAAAAAAGSSAFAAPHSSGGRVHSRAAAAASGPFATASNLPVVLSEVVTTLRSPADTPKLVRHFSGYHANRSNSIQRQASHKPAGDATAAAAPTAVGAVAAAASATAMSTVPPVSTGGSRFGGLVGLLRSSRSLARRTPQPLRSSTAGQPHIYDHAQQMDRRAQPWGAAAAASGEAAAATAATAAARDIINGNERPPAVLSRIGWHLSSLWSSGGGAQQQAHAATAPSSAAGAPRICRADADGSGGDKRRPAAGTVAVVNAAAALLEDGALPAAAAAQQLQQLLPPLPPAALLCSDTGDSSLLSASAIASGAGGGGGAAAAGSASSAREPPPWLLLRTAPPDLLLHAAAGAAQQAASRSTPAVGSGVADRGAAAGAATGAAAISMTARTPPAAPAAPADDARPATSDVSAAAAAAAASPAGVLVVLSGSCSRPCVRSSSIPTRVAGVAGATDAAAAAFDGGMAAAPAAAAAATATAPGSAAAAAEASATAFSAGQVESRKALCSPQPQRQRQQCGISDGGVGGGGGNAGDDAVRLASTATRLLGGTKVTYSSNAPAVHQSLDQQQQRRRQQQLQQQQPAAVAAVAAAAAAVAAETAAPLPSAAASSIYSGANASALLSVHPVSVPEGDAFSCERIEHSGIIVGAPAAAAAAAVSALSAPSAARATAAAPPLPRPQASGLLLDEVESLLARADDLQYDMWALADATAGRPLSVMAFFLFQRQGLIRHFGIKPLKLVRLLRAVESGYPNNPYHNATHAADVVRTTHVLAHAACLTAHHLDTLGLLALYFAAVIHDFGHPGLTGDFLVATSHPLALRYNDRSPLENHHASAAFTLMAERPELDAFEGLSREQRIAFRKQVVELVMGTDMKQHFGLLSQFTNAVSAQRLKQHQHQQQPLAAPAVAAVPADAEAQAAVGGGSGGGGGVAMRGRRREPAQQQQQLAAPPGAVVVTIGDGGGAVAAAAESDVSQQKSASTRRDHGGVTSTSGSQAAAKAAASADPCAQHHHPHSPNHNNRTPTAADTFSAPSNVVHDGTAAPAARKQTQPVAAAGAVTSFMRQSMPVLAPPPVLGCAPVATAQGQAAAAVPAPPPLPPADESQRLLALQICLKVADIGHLAGTLPVHKRWLGVLEEEFFRQGDKEREAGLPISPLFDRAKQGVSKSQAGFYEFVALPLVRALTSAFPGATPLVRCYEANYEYWKMEQQQQQQQQ